MSEPFDDIELDLKEKIQDFLQNFGEQLFKYTFAESNRAEVSPGSALQIAGKALVNLGTHFIGMSLGNSELSSELFDEFIKIMDQFEEDGRSE